MADSESEGRRERRYITPDGFRKLEQELQWLWKQERPKVTQEVTEAAAQGDRSENAEYIYGKKRLREIDRRIRTLSKRLDELTVVSTTPPDSERVFFGAWVTVEDGEGVRSEYRIVGPDEFDISAGLISISSPLGRALVGKCEGDEFEFQRPKGPTRYAVIAVRYEG